MKGVDEHLAAALAVVRPPAAADLPLLEALDCVLTRDVTSTVALPGFDNSSMDGYAVRAEDVAGAGEQTPVVLPVVGDLPAGSPERLRLEPGTAIRIMTGAPVPDGTGGIVPVEWTDGGVDRVQVRRAVAVGRNVRRAGEDVEPGQVLLRAGQRLGARHVALLAAVGRDRVPVRPRPRVAVLSTGSELVEPGRPVGVGQVSDANGVLLTAAAEEAGAVATRVGIVGDDTDALLTVLTEQLALADVVVTSGGVSMGAYDTVKEALSRLGTVAFDKVAMQPGMPQGFGTLGEGTPIFTLPGNPVSSYVSFEVFVRPCLRAMLGEADLQRPSVVAVAGAGWSSPDGKRQFVRARVARAGGQHVVTPVGGHGSHLVADLAAADALAVVPEATTSVETGDEVTCLLLERVRR